MIQLVDGSRFYHLPRTGGTWVGAVLDELKAVRKKHKRWEKHSIPSVYDSKGFTFVREQNSWLWSWYRYQTARHWKQWGVKRFHPCSWLNDTPEEAKKSFDAFIQWVDCNQFERMVHMYTNVGFVGNFETLEDDLYRILTSRGYSPRKCRAAIDKTAPKNVGVIKEA